MKIWGNLPNIWAKLHKIGKYKSGQKPDFNGGKLKKNAHAHMHTHIYIQIDTGKPNYLFQ